MLFSVDHLHILFSHSNGTAPVMSSRGNRLKPRLDRRNAAKHIDYDAGSDDSPLLVTRSLERSDKTSFRIEGIEGEIDVICRTLGLSGPEDLAISAAAWEARKIRSSSDLLLRTRFNSLDTPFTEKEKEKYVPDEDICEVLVLDGVLPLQGLVELTRGDSDELEEGECSTSNRVVVATEFKLNPGSVFNGGGSKGINGIRPPALKPPPVMALKPLDDDRSTWDLLRDFAPERDRIRSSLMVQDSSSDEEGGEEEIGEAIAQMEGTEDTGGRIGVTAELSTSCSSTTSIYDDSSTSTTEADLMTISPNWKWKRIITGWEKGPLLGRGSFGAVYEGITDDGFFFAVKEVSLLDQGSQGQQSILQLEQEIALLSQFEHENIVQYYGTEKDESKLYIFLEFVKGSLLSVYQKYKLIDSQASAYTRQILQGLKYLHERNVVHRDIKCANILVHSSGSVKLADFGLAKATKLNDVKSCKGTPFWMAPEVVNRKNQGYGIPADIWSLGCTVLEMLTGHIPYSDLEPMQALFRIGKGEPPPIPDDISKDAREFVLKCLQVKPDQRPSAAELLNHSFLKWRPPMSSGSSPPYSSRHS